MAWRFYNDPNGLAVGFGVLPRMAPCKGRGPEESVDAEADGEESEGAGEPGGAEGPEGAEAGRRGRGPEGAETVRSAESGRKWPKVAGDAEGGRRGRGGPETMSGRLGPERRRWPERPRQAGRSRGCWKMPPGRRGSQALEGTGVAEKAEDTVRFRLVVLARDYAETAREHLEGKEGT